MYGDTLTLNIHDSINDERFQISISFQLTVGDLIERLTEERGLPRYDFLGEPLGYELFRLTTDQVLSRRETFTDINLRDDEIFELRGKEASLVKDLIDELLEEIAENIAQELFDKARDTLQRIDRTRASSSEIEAARRNLQSAAVRARLAADPAAEVTLQHQPGGDEVTLPASDRGQHPAQEAKFGGRRRGCLTLGLVGGALLLVGAALLLVLVILPGLQTSTPAAPPPQVPTEEPVTPVEPEPGGETCEDAASAERIFVDPEAQIASVTMVNQGSCIWEPNAYALELADGFPIQQAVVLDRQVQPGAFAELVMNVPAEYFEDSRFSLYEFKAPSGPLAEVIFDYALEEAQCEDFASVVETYIDSSSSEAVFLLINKGDCQWDQGTYQLVYVTGDLIQPSQDLPFTVVPGSRVEIRMPIPPEYFREDRSSVYAMARDGQPFDETAVVTLNIVD